MSESIEDGDGKIWSMVGIVPGKCRMTKTLGPFGREGETFLAHEFHYSLMEGGTADFSLSKSNGRSWSGGTASKYLYAAYPHLYFYANPEIAENFVRAMEEVTYVD